MAESKINSGLSDRSVAELEAMREVAENIGFSKGHPLGLIVEALQSKSPGDGSGVGFDECRAEFYRVEAMKRRIREGVAARVGK